jgi:1,4-alpha-glucan branching enzyme
MYTLGSKKGSVKFVIKPANHVKKVLLAGDFNGWKPTPLKADKTGVFSATITAGPGRYEYKFILDDQWVHDNDVKAAVRNSYGTLNSVAVIA